VQKFKSEDEQIVLFAQPSDAAGFHFASVEGFEKKAAQTRSPSGQLVEKYEIEFFEGDELAKELFAALGVDQRSFGAFLTACNYWNTEQKYKVIIAITECGIAFDLHADNPDKLAIEIYDTENLGELTPQSYPTLSDHVSRPIDLNSIAHELRHEYNEITIAGVPLVYRCG
jgi:hypothetical protein